MKTGQKRTGFIMGHFLKKLNNYLTNYSWKCFPMPANSIRLIQFYISKEINFSY
jgi:hypothetical protein